MHACTCVHTHTHTHTHILVTCQAHLTMKACPWVHSGPRMLLTKHFECRVRSLWCQKVRPQEHSKWDLTTVGWPVQNLEWWIRSRWRRKEQPHVQFKTPTTYCTPGLLLIACETPLVYCWYQPVLSRVKSYQPFSGILSDFCIIPYQVNKQKIWTPQISLNIGTHLGSKPHLTKI